MTESKNLSLEGLRGVASLIVFFAHAVFMYFPYLGSLMRPYPDAQAKSIVDAILIYPPFNLLYCADAAVVVFFVLSGYVLTTKYFQRDSTQLLESAAFRRYWRLILPGAASALLAWFIMKMGLMGNKMAVDLNMGGWTLEYYSHEVTFARAIWISFVEVPFFGNSFDLNGPLWTLQIELIGSLLLFSSYAILRRRSLVMSCVWFAFIADVLASAGPSILYYLAILAGSLLNLGRAWLAGRAILSTILVALGVLGVMADNAEHFAWLRSLSLPNLQPFGPDFNKNPVLLWQTLGSVALVAGVLGSGWVARCLSSRPLVFLGKISFSLYLIHTPVLMSLTFWLMKFCRDSGTEFLISFAVSFGLTTMFVIAVAELFRRVVDEPSIRASVRLAADWRLDPGGLLGAARAVMTRRFEVGPGNRTS